MTHPVFLTLPSATITKRWVGDVTAAASVGIILFTLDLLCGVNRSVGSTLHVFLTLLSRLECRQEVLHHPDFPPGAARGEGDMMTARIKRKAADRIHGQPKGVRFSSMGRDREQLGFLLPVCGSALAEDD